MAVIPYEQFHVNEKNSWFYYACPSYNNLSVALRLPHGNYTVKENADNITTVIRKVDPYFSIKYEKATSSFTMTNSEHAFVIDNLTFEIYSSPASYTVPRTPQFTKNVTPTKTCLDLFGLDARTSSKHSGAAHVIKSSKPVTNGRLRCVYISSDLCRHNMMSTEGSTDYSDVMAVAPVLTEPLEELMWQAQRPMFIHLPSVPSEISIRLSDEHGDDLILYSNWIVQFTFRKNPRNSLNKRVDRIFEAIRYIALK